MKKKLHNIDKLFKAALDDHMESPPEAIWDAIDKRLDKNKVVDINKKYIQLKRIAIALLVLLLGFGAYTLNHWTKISNTAPSDSTRNTIEKTNNQVSPAPVPANTKNNTVAASETIDTNTIAVATPVKPTAPESTANVIGNRLVISATTEQNKPAGNTIVAAEKGSHNTEQGSILKSKISVEAQEDMVNNTATTKNVLLRKRRIKATITNGGIAEVNKSDATTADANGTKPPISPDSVDTEGKNSASYLKPISPLDAKLISAVQTGRRNDLIETGKKFLPNGLGLTQRPGKKNTIRNTGALSATLFFAPNISSNLLKEEPHYRPPGGGQPPVDHDDRDKIRRGETRQSSFSLGVLLDYNLNKHWSVQSGLALTSRVIYIGPKTIYADKDDQGEIKYRFNCSSGYTFLSSTAVANPSVGDSLQAFGATNTLRYISIPLALKYHYYVNKFDLFGTAGTAFNILTKGKIATEIGNVASKEVSTSNSINGLKSTYFSGNIGLGLSYTITRSIAFTFMPSYNFALNSSTRDATVKTYPNNISLAAGIRYKL
jgi:hypothetical protein